MNGALKLKTFAETKAKESKLPLDVIKEALKSFFGEGVLEKADKYADRTLGVDYFYKTKRVTVSVDIKIRSDAHRYLVLEKEWYNKPKKAWLYSSKADYFLFIHSNMEKLESFDCYLVAASDARELVEKVEPRLKRAWIDRDYSVAMMYFYEYDDLGVLGKSYEQVTLE